MIQNHC